MRLIDEYKGSWDFNSEISKVYDIFDEIIPIRYQKVFVGMFNSVMDYIIAYNSIKKLNNSNNRDIDLISQLQNYAQQILQLSSDNLDSKKLLEIGKLLKKSEVINTRLVKSNHEVNIQKSSRLLGEYQAEIKEAVRKILEFANLYKNMDPQNLEVRESHKKAIDNMEIDSQSKQLLIIFIEKYRDFFVTIFEETLKTASKILNNWNNRNLYASEMSELGYSYGYNYLYGHICNQLIGQSFDQLIPGMITMPQFMDGKLDSTMFFMSVISDLVKGKFKDLSEEELKIILDKLDEKRLTTESFGNVENGIEYLPLSIYTLISEYNQKQLENIDFDENQDSQKIGLM